VSDRGRCSVQRDSPLEGAGFEPSVPPAAVSSGHLDARDATHAAGWRAWVTSDTTRWRRTVTGSLRKSMVLTQSCGVSTSQIHGSGASIRQPDLPGSSLVAKACRHPREGVGHERDAKIRRPDLRGSPPAPKGSRRAREQPGRGPASFGKARLDHPIRFQSPTPTDMHPGGLCARTRARAESPDAVGGAAHSMLPDRMP
jgi:hypothetical protein